jgi:exopolyphosphatase/guanosine-5'-triphosphate,3'-diphosphate pyrophosphatase
VAVRLLDETSALHGLGALDRELLETAARVHDIGVRISPDRHHKHGAYIVEHAGMRGFSPDEIAVLASMIRFQRGGDPKPTYPPFASLDPLDRDRCTLLVALLRLAHGLARTGRGALPTVSASVGKRRVRIGISATDAGPLAAEGRSQAGLLAEVLGRPVDVKAAVPAAGSA